MKPPFDIAGDLDTPVSAFAKLGAFNPRFLLESVEGGERLARYSFIGFGKCLEVKLDAAGLQVGNAKLPRPAHKAELLDALRKALAAAPKPLPEMAGVPLAGGLVGRVLGAQMWSGQYLPDWHPWADYRTEYSARRALGGGVLLDSIHSFDTLRWMLGEPAEVTGMLGRVSDLEIDTEDVAAAIVRLESGALVALNKDTGQEVWRAKGIRSSWNTPVLVDAPDGTELVVDESKAVLGFDPASVPDSRLGLCIMRERMAQVGGTLTITSMPAGGTLVAAEAPLNPAGRTVGGPGVSVLERI